MNSIGQVQAPLLGNQLIAPSRVENKGEGFGELFKSALQEVNAAQKESQLKTTQLAMGEGTDIHDVMIASQKSSLSLQLTIQMRNKAVEAYQEIMRMQV
ncbi:flagellar hook-basal body complex protein FliE [Bacillus sp. FJAT-27251]|uniref:flagellar hook-basal body complex protein FliE n=1 Tax=Bacillus sp. FJAT-27251 TaxID=1684142 RepID=UPI0006A766B0|nr:flagellar hook-basal body complex protein FliE [Bacillus sp. FJAT-27251]